MKVWVCTTSAEGVTGEVTGKAELLFGRNLQETATLKEIGSKHLLLLTGGYDSQIHVYSTLRGQEQTELSYRFSMLGHFNSIKNMAFSPELGRNAENPNLRDVTYLASCSQDQNIRVWKIQPLDNLAKQEEEEKKVDVQETNLEGENEEAVGGASEWTKQFVTKTSYVLSLDGERVYNFTLESVLQHHQEAVSSL